MTFDLSIPSQLAAALTPDLILMAGAMALLLIVVWGAETAERDRLAGRLALLLCALTAATVIWMAVSDVSAGPGMIAVDNFRWVVDLLILLATAITIALSMDENRRDGIVLGEGYVMVLFAAAGMMVLAAARDLVLVFLGIELMSIAVYVLAGLNRRSARAAEASLKYFLLGAFATGFLLYGIALVYGATGSTQFSVIGGMLSGARMPSVVMLLGVAMLVVGFGFKIAAVPFHMWTPDVYEGSPTPFTAFMAAGVKTAAFASLIRLWIEAFAGIRMSWIPVIWWLAAATMIFGNLVALQQKNVKRMLAYSSIAHAGYLLVALSSASLAATSTLVFYMMAYTLATMGAFAVVVAVSRPGGHGQRVSDLEGLWQSNPWLAAAMAVFMMSLLGFPIAGGMGFIAKWYVLKTALTGAVPQTSLAVILVLTSVVSAGYYLGIVVTMFMKPLAPDVPRAGPTPRLTGWVIGIAAVAILVFGLWPDRLLVWSVRSTPSAAHLQGPTAAAPPLAPR